MEELSKQINLYSVDTKAFYTPEERNYSNIKAWSGVKIKRIKENLQAESQEFVLNNKELVLEICRYDYITNLLEEGYSYLESLYITNNEFNKDKALKEFQKEVCNMLIKKHKHLDKYKKINKIAENKFLELINSNTKVRKLNKYYLNDINKISLFDSSLTRTLALEINGVTNEILVIRPYHYPILEQLIKDGYDYNGNHYVILTASAGQIRTKKCVFINEKLFNDNEKTFMCGLTIEAMNNSEQKGMNLTKFMAYLALNNSATKEWEGFDIDKSIVIKDFETNVNGWVDYIDVKKLKDAKTIEECIKRKRMDVPIPHSDGCGLMLPTLSKKNFMVRLPWCKGLLTPCDYLKFCKTERLVSDENDRYKIKDYWGKEHDLIEEDIQVIFTESQFKAIKYYQDWEEYKKYFKQYNCKANLCNIEPNTKDFRKASLNYQMLQTITDISDEEIEYFTNPIDEYLSNGYTDRETQLDILGVNKYYKTNIQKALELYPEMIQESYVKSLLSDNLGKKKKQAKYGKFKVEAKYTFAIPDVYAWMEFVFNDDKNPKGILKHKHTVSCRLYKNNPHLTINRSPHLSKELGVSINVCNKETRKWFITDGCYTSCHGLLTKLLQNDNDGDKYLVIADEVYYNIAKRNMKGVVPLYYEMAKAKSQLINSGNIYKALTEGYRYGNVGQYSNKITIMFNQPNVDYSAIKLLTCLNNFYIDGAKTGYMPEISNAIKNRLKGANGKLPYFFIFAKDKEKNQVKPINNSTVNRICKRIENVTRGKFDFSHHGTFRKNILLNNKDIEINEDLIKYYIKLDREKNMIFKHIKNNESPSAIINGMKQKILDYSCQLNINEIDVVDMIVKYVYDKHKNLKKTLLWDMFGEYIIKNINKNLPLSLMDNKVKMCEECGKRFKKKVNNQQYCNKCSKKIQKQQINEWKDKNKEKAENRHNH